MPAIKLKESNLRSVLCAGLSVGATGVVTGAAVVTFGVDGEGVVVGGLTVVVLEGGVGTGVVVVVLVVVDVVVEDVIVLFSGTIVGSGTGNFMSVVFLVVVALFPATVSGCFSGPEIDVPVIVSVITRQNIVNAISFIFQTKLVN